MSTSDTPRPAVSAGDTTVTMPAVATPTGTGGARAARGTRTSPGARAAAKPAVEERAAGATRSPGAAPTDPERKRAASPGGSAASPTAAAAPASPAATPARPSRRARLVLARVDPWSVMKLSFLLAVALAVVTVTAVAVLWSVLESMGVFAAAGRTIADVTQGESGGGFELMDYAGLSRVLGVTTVLACVNVVLITALSTLGAFLYNLAASLVGGLHVTLSEDA